MQQLITKTLAAFTRLLYKQTILLLVLLLCAGVVGGLWKMSRLSSNLIESQARRDVALYAQAINQAPNLYSSEAVNRLAKVHAVTLTDNTKSGLNTPFLGKQGGRGGFLRQGEKNSFP